LVSVPFQKQLGGTIREVRGVGSRDLILVVVLPLSKSFSAGADHHPMTGATSRSLIEQGVTFWRRKAVINLMAAACLPGGCEPPAVPEELAVMEQRFCRCR
jgi:hypothetical protein